LTDNENSACYKERDLICMSIFLDNLIYSKDFSLHFKAFFILMNIFSF